MIEIAQIFLLIILHFVGDFILQTEEMAAKKSSSNKYLLLHVGAYSSVFLLVSFKFAIITGVLHFVVDYVSSRITKHLRKKQEIHWFFVIIGLDQAIHLLCIMGTYHLMFY